MDKILQKEISICTYCILYKPLKDEVDFDVNDFPLKLASNKIYLPNNNNTNPFDLADKLSKELVNEKVFLLIPGTKFDIYGTRHGRGGGWYDRFLSKVPKDWIRIGITGVANFSKSNISKNEWDETVHFIILNSKNVWCVYISTN